VNFTEVYDVRAAYKETLAEESFIGIRWLLYIFNPFLIIIGYLDKDKRLLLVLGFIGEFMIYSTAGFKTALFIGFIIVFFLYISSKYNLLKKFSQLVLYSIIVIFVFAMIGDLFFFSEEDSYKNILTSLTVRRNFIVPGFLTGHYYDFFSNNPKAYMAGHKIFGILVGYKSDYSESIQTLIGTHIFGREELNANVNIWADAYANFGLLGMLITTIVLFIFLLFYDNLSKGLDPRLSFTLLIGPLAFFSNSALFTSIFGHGAIWVIILIYLYKSFIINKNKAHEYNSKYSSQ